MQLTISVLVIRDTYDFVYPIKIEISSIYLMFLIVKIMNTILNYLPIELRLDIFVYLFGDKCGSVTKEGNLSNNAPQGNVTKVTPMQEDKITTLM